MLSTLYSEYTQRIQGGMFQSGWPTHSWKLGDEGKGCAAGFKEPQCDLEIGSAKQVVGINVNVTIGFGLDRIAASHLGVF